MRITLSALLSGALLTLSLATSALALDVIYPADGTYVTRSDFLVIKGGTSPLLDGFVVTIDGVPSDLLDVSAAEYRAAFGDFLILQPEWITGKNTIVVDGYVAGKVVAQVRAECYYLGHEPNAMAPRKFGPFVMHQSQKEVLCLPCHVMNPDKAQLAAESAEQNPCASCHRRMLAQPHVHGPAGVYQCVSCHDPASRPSRYQLVKTGAALCVECHADKIDDFSKNKFVHGPVGSGLCIVCHDAHASAYPAQLIAPTNTLCLGCHETILSQGAHVVRGVSGKSHPLSGPRDPANPDQALSCTSCHDPHGGQVQSLFRHGITSRMQLCQLCHKK